MDYPASTAPADQGTGAIDQNQNELATQISEQDEATLVDKVLGVSGPPKVFSDFGSDNKPVAPSDSKPADDKPKEDEKEEESDDEDKSDEAKKAAEDEKKAAEAKAAEDKKAAAGEEDEENKAPADIPAVDLSDLWVDVDAYSVTTDDEGKQQRTEKTVRISVDGGLEALTDDIFFKSDKQMAEILDSLNEMRGIKKERQAEHDKAVAEKEATEAKAADEKATLANWDEEIADLVAAGTLEAPKVAPDDPKFLEDPSAQKIDEVFKFMAEENKKRSAEGKNPIRSFALAFNLLSKDQSKVEEEAKAKQEAEDIKKRGALVGGGSSASAGSGKDFVYKSGSAKSIWAVNTDDI